jgi:hypothetical protein
MVNFAKTYGPENQSEAMAGLTICAVLISTIINLVILHRVYGRVYMQTIRIAFMLE